MPWWVGSQLLNCCQVDSSLFFIDYSQILNKLQRTIDFSVTSIPYATDLGPCFTQGRTHHRSSNQPAQSIQPNFWHLRESFRSLIGICEDHVMGTSALSKALGSSFSTPPHPVTLFTLPWGSSHTLSAWWCWKDWAWETSLSFQSPCLRMGVFCTPPALWMAIMRGLGPSAAMARSKDLVLTLFQWKDTVAAADTSVCMFCRASPSLGEMYQLLDLGKPLANLTMATMKAYSSIQLYY